MTEQTPRDIHDLMNQGTVIKPERFLDEPAKLELAQAGTPFVVKDVQMVDTEEYGTKWQVTAVLGDEPITFRLGLHEKRDPFMSSIAGVLTEGPIGGLRLRAGGNRGGHPFVTLEAS